MAKCNQQLTPLPFKGLSDPSFSPTFKRCLHKFVNGFITDTKELHVIINLIRKWCKM